MVAPVAGSEVEEHMAAAPRLSSLDRRVVLVKPVEEVTGRGRMVRWPVADDSVAAAEHTEDGAAAHAAAIGRVAGAAEDAEDAVGEDAEGDAVDGVASVAGRAGDAGCREAEHEDVVVAAADAAVGGGVADRSAMVHTADDCRVVSPQETAARRN